MSIYVSTFQNEYFIFELFTSAFITHESPKSVNFQRLCQKAIMMHVIDILPTNMTSECMVRYRERDM